MTSRTASPALQTTRKQSSTPTPAARPASTKPAPPPPAATASPAPPAAPLPDLAALLNLPIRVRVAAAGPDAPEREIEGALFAVDGAFVVLSSAPSSEDASPPATPNPSGAPAPPQRTYHLLKTSSLLSVTALSSVPDAALPSPSMPLSFAHLPSTPTELSSAVARAQAARARVGQGVSADAQALFDALARTLPVRWAGQSIVVLEEVVVEAPYGVANVKGAKGSAERVERVKKMLEGIRTRLGLTTPQLAT
ncbi:hypothetical protein JCM10450v2_000872 [Rhodotorula kratochvilovae]